MGELELNVLDGCVDCPMLDDKVSVNKNCMLFEKLSSEDLVKFKKIFDKSLEMEVPDEDKLFASKMIYGLEVSKNGVNYYSIIDGDLCEHVGSTEGNKDSVLIKIGCWYEPEDKS